VGVDAFLSKPFEPAELVRMVRQLVERARGGGREHGGSPDAGGDGDGAQMKEVDQPAVP
jgi:DNA-binding response OmpR family regulator